jgi:hypothetical protein
MRIAMRILNMNYIEKKKKRRKEGERERRKLMSETMNGKPAISHICVRSAPT